MSSVERRIRRNLRYRMAPRDCHWCEKAESTCLYLGQPTCASCAAINARADQAAEAADEEANAPPAFEPITYDPSDGSAKGVRG